MKQLDRRKVETMGWPILEPIQAEGVPRPIALSKDVCVAGAREAVNLKLSSPLISRTHALFVADRDSIYLRDLASRNHTYLNDEPIREAVLRNGDVIGLGPLTFRCQSGFDRRYEPDKLHVPPGELRMESDDSRFPLTGRTALIGSRPDCDILLTGDDIDPAHAVIFQREGRRFIRDLRSHSYTLVNNQPVKEIELQPGDRVQIGATHLIYEVQSDSIAPELPLDLDDTPELPKSAPAEDDRLIPLSLDDATEEEIPLSAEPVEAQPSAMNLPETVEQHEDEKPDPVSQSQQFAGDVPLRPEEPQHREEIPYPLADRVEELDLHPAARIIFASHDGGHKSEYAPDSADALELAHAEEPEAQSARESFSHADFEPDPSPSNEEKLTELLGELVETVAQVQSTWEEIKCGAHE